MLSGKENSDGGLRPEQVLLPPHVLAPSAQGQQPVVASRGNLPTGPLT